MERLKAIIQYIERNYAEKITVAEAARLASLSPYHFCRVFKKATGRSFVEYVNLYRIRIAEKAGFCTVNYFAELFKRYRGCTPSQYRGSSLP